MKITLWIPSADSSARWPVVNSVWNLETPDNIKLRLIRSGANNVRYSWNKVIKDFLDTTTDDWLLSWHSDVVGVPGTLMRLLSWNQSIVSALIFMRTSPVMPHIWQHYPKQKTYSPRIQDTRRWLYAHADYCREFGPFVMEPRPDDALVPVDFTSTSCMLIHRSALIDMRKEMNDVWFKWDDDYNGGGEDRNFCEHATKAGYTVYVDRSCVVGHLAGDIPTSAADFLVWDSVSNVLGTGEPREIIK